MAGRRKPQPGNSGGDRTMMMFTTLMLILVSMFASLLSRANFDETKYAAVVSSVRASFGNLIGGRVATGDDDGLPDQSLGFDEGGQLVLPEMEMAQVRALLAPAIVSRDARIIHTRNQRIVSLSAGLLFHLDSSELSEEAIGVLSDFARIVADSPVTIAVEGHTNNLPPQTEGVGDNWDISARRALAVLNYLSGPGGLAPERLSAFGYAGVKPLHSNRTPAGRARNNRVDLVLDFSQARAKDLQNLAEKAESYNFRGFEFLLRGDFGDKQ